MKFHIALAFDNQEEFSVVLISNIIKKSDPGIIHFHLFISEVVDYDKYTEILCGLNVNYTVYVIRDYELKNLQIDNTIYGWISNAAFYRLFIAEKIPNDIDWILYLDTDIWVKFDILEIFRLIDNSFPLIVAQKNSGTAFNSGVMLINCKLYREQLPSNISIAEIKKNNFPADNEFLISYFKNETGSVDLIYNFPVYFYKISLDYLGYFLNSPFRYIFWFKKYDFGPKIDDAKIVHFMGPWKPWNYFTLLPFANEWRDEYKLIFNKSPWHKINLLDKIHKQFNRFTILYLRFFNILWTLLKITGLTNPLVKVKRFFFNKLQ
jgi:lipopolysaccharide biosynthesis glycosyltransferase